MKMKVTLKVEYKSGRYRQLAWFENDPKYVEGEGDDQIKRTATTNELENAICKSLHKMMDENTIRSFKDIITEKAVIIRFSEISEIEVSIEEVK